MMLTVLVLGPHFEQQSSKQDESKLKPYGEQRASLVAPMVENLPSMQETWVSSLAWKNPLERGMATHSSIA